MTTKLTIDIAWALLLARWKQTLVAAIGVMFSNTVFIALLGFMTGLNIMLDDLVVNRTPHVRIFNEVRQNPRQPITLVSGYEKYHHFISSIKTSNSREELYNSASLMNVLHQDPRVAGIAPKITTVAFFASGNKYLNATLSGIDVQGEEKLLHFFDYIKKGDGNNLAIITNSVVLGKALADLLVVDVGDMVYVTSATGETFPLKVVALYQSGLNDLDKVTAYTSLATAQKMLSKPATWFTDMQVKLYDIRLAPAVALEYKKLFDTQARDIQTANAEFETGSFIRTLIAFIVGITLLTVAGFGIFNILNMMIYEKMDSIAIMKATGFSGADVRRIFLVIALSIGIAGGVTGLGLGYLLSIIIDAIPFHSEALPNIKTYPINYSPVFYFIAIVFSVFTTYFAGMFPASKAGKVDPVVIIRGK